MHSLCLNVLKICFVMLLCYANAETSYAQKRFAQITLTSSDHDGIIETNRPVTLTASIKNKLDEVINGTVVWSANSPCFQSLPPVHQAITLRRQQTIAHTFCFSMPCAGFAEIKCQLVTSKNEKTRFGTMSYWISRGGHWMPTDKRSRFLQFLGGVIGSTCINSTQFSTTTQQTTITITIKGFRL